MEFHVGQLLQEPVGARREYQVHEACPMEDSGPSAPVSGSVSLLRTDVGVLAIGDVDTAVSAICSRCLVPTQVPVALHFEEEYYPTVDIVNGTRLPLPEEPTPFLIDEHHILDVCEAIRQQAILAEPMQPLCKENCLGFCPTCGADLNQGPCSCSPAEGDDRWAALSNLLRSSEN